VLRLPRFDTPFILSTDASGVAISANLSQKVNGLEKPVTFASRQLGDAERNYTVTERECLAVVW